MLITDAIARYLNYIEHEKRLSPLSLEVYSHELYEFAKHLHTIGIDDIDDITMREPREWQVMRMEEGLKPTTIKKMISALRGWSKYMLRQQWMKTDIMGRVVVPRTPKPLPVFFKESEVEHIYDGGLFPPDFNGQRDRLLLRLLYETGMRRSEAAGLTIQSIDHSARCIRVIGKRNKERVIPIEDELLKNINEYLTLREQIDCEDNHLLVSDNGKAVNADKVYTIVKHYMPALSNADRISPHVFRHTFATHILNQGGNIDAIKELLGHSNLNSTEIYTHVTREHLKENYKNAHPRANGER